jgi:hypothetical protein
MATTVEEAMVGATTTTAGATVDDDFKLRNEQKIFFLNRQKVPLFVTF